MSQNICPNMSTEYTQLQTYTILKKRNTTQNTFSGKATGEGSWEKCKTQYKKQEGAKGGPGVAMKGD